MLITRPIGCGAPGTLVQRKTLIPESNLMPRTPELDAWIEHTYQEVEASIPDIPSFDKPGWDAYDHAFLDVLGICDWTERDGS